MLNNKNNKSFFFNLFTIVLISVFLVSGCGKKDEANKDAAGDKSEKKTEISSETITENTPVHYVMDATGDIQGTYDIYSKGKNLKVNMDVTTHGQKTMSDLYSDGQMIYLVTSIAEKKVGMKMDPKSFKEENEGKKEFNPLNFREGCKDCEKIGEEEVNGKKCIIYKDKNGTKYSVYNEQIPLKIVMEKSTMTVKSLDVNAKFSDDVFTVPKDIEFLDMDKLFDMKDMKDSKGLKEEMKKMEDVMKNYKK
ncbi:MAG: hypothetical protein EHM58_09625 [Ignavibacteriae bacterium]|nr:MAG: hypothetical protein EHM58_09625 [Ignavibacteriota bacterium]